jgi:hypothetical protein
MRYEIRIVQNGYILTKYRGGIRTRYMVFMSKGDLIKFLEEEIEDVGAVRSCKA